MTSKTEMGTANCTVSCARQQQLVKISDEGLADEYAAEQIDRLADQRNQRVVVAAPFASPNCNTPKRSGRWNVETRVGR